MPHVIVKLWPGKSERQKARLSEEIVKDVIVRTYSDRGLCEAGQREVTHQGIATDIKRHRQRVGCQHVSRAVHAGDWNVPVEKPVYPVS